MQESESVMLQRVQILKYLLDMRWDNKVWTHNGEHINEPGISDNARLDTAITALLDNVQAWATAVSTGGGRHAPWPLGTVPQR
jgi:hypothetical protein